MGRFWEGFDAEKEEPSGFEALPKGDYVLVVVDGEMKDNKSGSGSHLELEMEVVDGDFAGRKLWVNYNIENANEVAQRIGRSELAALCKAVGIPRPKDEAELRNIPFIGGVIVDRKDPSRNQIRTYKATEGGSQRAAPEKSKPEKKEETQAAPAAPAADGGKRVPPWKRK